MSLLKSLIKFLIIWATRLFCPVNPQKVLFFSYYGAQYGCNPKYISEALQKKNDALDIVWAFNQPDCHNYHGIRCIKFASLRFYYELCTSRVVVTNYRMTESSWKRKNQFYIQTWHSSLRLKTIEGDAISALSHQYVKMAKADSKIIDYLVSGCRFSTEIFRKAFWYDGTILECGTARNDLYFSDNTKVIEKVRNHFNLATETKVALYAPTFRQGLSAENYVPDLASIASILEERDQCPWKVLVRLHPHHKGEAEDIARYAGAINATEYDDIQELLLVSALLITDYSSLMFDAAIAHIPCVLYAPDYEKYTRSERRLYFRIEELPFNLSLSEYELRNHLLGFSMDEYLAKLTSFNKHCGNFEKGTAANDIANLILTLTSH